MDVNSVPDVFPTVAEVLRYLHEAGWRVSKSAVYEHVRTGKLLPSKNGMFLRRTVDRYAQKWLKPRNPDEVPEQALQLKRLRADLRRARERAALVQSRVERLMREYLLREQVALDLASHRALFQGLLPELASRMVEVAIETTEGDPARANEAKAFVLHHLTQCLEAYDPHSEEEEGDESDTPPADLE